MDVNNIKKSKQLGMPLGTASGRLRKSILFHLVTELNRNICYQCNNKIFSENELSIEHKIPYLDSSDPVKLFFDIENIAFSHLSCNVSAARRTVKTKHPSVYAYNQGYRCKDCTVLKNIRLREFRGRKKVA